MDGVALTPLTVDVHESGLVTGLNAESQQGFWFQLSQQQRQEVAPPWGPQQLQALNRYADVQNNPLRYTDPPGHTVYLTQQEAAVFAEILHEIADAMTEKKENWHLDTQALIAAAVSQPTGPVGKLLAAIAGSLNTFDWKAIAKWRGLARCIEQMNGAEGVVIGGGRNAGYGFSLWVLSRSTGDMIEVKLGPLHYLKMVP